MNFKKVKMIDGDGNKKPYGDRTPTTGNINAVSYTHLTLPTSSWV